jgi:DNA-directed RNA polymerase specialized sigma subunit
VEERREAVNTKDYLCQAFLLDQRISAKVEHVSSLRKLLKQVTSLHAEEEKEAEEAKEYSLRGNTRVKILELEQEVDGDIDRLIDLKREMMSGISTVEQPEYHVLLELRYLSFLTWEEIAERMNYSPRQIHRLHGQALKQFELGKMAHCGIVCPKPT